ncbi:DUF4416 family protein [Thermoproteota archaeon]
MGEIIQQQPVKLIVSIFTKKRDLFRKIEGVFSKKFGPIDYRSPILDFDQTDYYEIEFGKGLKRKFFSFEKLIDSADLWKVKIFSNKLEEKFSRGKKRLVNIDPGYISLANLILASTKNFFHRIHISKGIFQEVTMIYQDKTYKSLAWTYPDYFRHKDIFLKMRTNLHRQLKEINTKKK